MFILFHIIPVEKSKVAYLSNNIANHAFIIRNSD